MAEINMRERAEVMARKLFPDDIADNSDCHNEHGREGEPCRICAEKNLLWRQRILDVHLALLEAF